VTSGKGGKDLSSDTQIRVIGSIEHEKYTKEFPISGILELEAS